jgi:hypothetical protein
VHNERIEDESVVIGCDFPSFLIASGCADNDNAVWRLQPFFCYYFSLFAVIEFIFVRNESLDAIIITLLAVEGREKNYFIVTQL